MGGGDFCLQAHQRQPEPAFSCTGRPKARAALASYLIFRQSLGGRRRRASVITARRRNLRRSPRPRWRRPRRAAPSAPETRSDGAFALRHDYACLTCCPSPHVHRSRTPSPPQVVWQRIGTSRNQTKISNNRKLLDRVAFAIASQPARTSTCGAARPSRAPRAAAPARRPEHGGAGPGRCGDHGAAGRRVLDCACRPRPFLDHRGRRGACSRA